jgi:hypothetical protein
VVRISQTSTKSETRDEVKLSLWLAINKIVPSALVRKADFYFYMWIVKSREYSCVSVMSPELLKGVT